MKRLFLLLLYAAVGITALTAQDDYYIKKARSYQREAGYYQKKANDYRKEGAYYLRNAENYQLERHITPSEEIRMQWIGIKPYYDMP